jgi:hypothetical protein
MIDKPLIEPIYSHTGPNVPIDLGSPTVQFSCGDETYRKEAKALMRFVPPGHVWFVFPVDGQLALSAVLQEDGTKLSLTERGTSVDVLYSGSGECPGFVSKASVVAPTPPSESLSVVVFHLFNFPEFSGPEDYFLSTTQPQRPSPKPCGRATLTADGWRITIAATDRTGDHNDSLRAQGGYVITHMGRIEREDGSEFSSGQLEDLLMCVDLFLSFALGRWAGVALPVGLDAAGNKTFEQWGLPQTTAGGWCRSCSWFDENHGGLLSDVFPGFFALWNDRSWRKHLYAVLYWYLAANEGSTCIRADAAIILAQAAIERLAWAYCVEHRKIVSGKAFEPRGLSAADRIRMLAATLGIPTELPATMAALNAKRGKKWDDIPDAITAVRNKLVHPKSQREKHNISDAIASVQTMLVYPAKASAPPSGSHFEAWQLSMWLLDLTLLRLCGHKGDYGNRLVRRWAGMVEQVPWAK